MSAPQAEQQLLLAVLALQTNFVNGEQLINALRAWIFDKSQPVGRILVQQGHLSEERHELLAALVAEHLKQHGGDPEKSLAALSSVGSVADDLRKLGDADVDATLSVLSNKRYAIESQIAETWTTDAASRKGAERFRILRPHARGGLGEVFVAEDVQLHRQVALKEIRIERAHDQESRERFVLEAEITGGLEHPGIVPVYGLGNYADGRPFYAMRFIRGDSLKDAIERYHGENATKQSEGDRALELRKLLGRFVDVCFAVEYAHSRGVLHRDLKPGNIMLGKYGETLVVDWGLAKVVGASQVAKESEERTLLPASASDSQPTMYGAAIGTPAYMSPEQALGKLDELGPTSDVYSLGATLYCLLTGQAPITGKDSGEILKKVANAEYPRPRQIEADIPIPLEAICMKAMSLRPSDRYDSPGLLADDVEKWLADEPVSAYKEPLTTRAGRWLRRHRSFVYGGIAVISVTVICLSAIVAVVASANHRLTMMNTKLDDTNAELERTNNDLDNTNRRLEVRNQELRVANEREREAKERIAGQKETIERQLVVSRAERFATLSELLRRDSPTQSVLLSVTACETTLNAGLPLLSTAHQSLHDALSSTGGLCLSGHTEIVSSVALSADGRWVATGSYDGTVRLWDLVSTVAGVNSPVVLRGHRGWIWTITFSPDSRWLISGSDDGTARAWDLSAEDPNTSCIEMRGHAGPISSLAVDPSSRTLVTVGGDKIVRVWDLTTENRADSPKILRGHQDFITCCAISADGRWLVTGSRDKTARLWDLTADDAASTVIELSGHEHWVGSVAFSSDGKRVITGSHDGTARVWSIEGDFAELVGVLSGHRGPVLSLAASPSSPVLVTGGLDATARIWDLNAEDPAMTAEILRGHDGPINCVAISSDGRWLVTASRDRTAMVWDLRAKERAETFFELRGHEDEIQSIALSPDGRWLATGSRDETGRLWDLARMGPTSAAAVLPGHLHYKQTFAFDADGQHLIASRGAEAVQWDLTVPDSLAAPIELQRHESPLESLAISPDGQWLVTGSRDKTARIHDLTKNNPADEALVLAGHHDDVRALAFSPDSQWLASAGGNVAYLWRLINGNFSNDPIELQGHSLAITSMKFSHDGRWLITASFDKTVRLWDVTSENVANTCHELSGHQEAIESLAVLPSGSSFVTGSRDRTARLWKVNADDPSRSNSVVLEHDDNVTSVAVAPNGRWLVTGSYDETARIWQIEAGDLINPPLVLRGHSGPVFSVAISPNSRLVAAGGTDGRVRVWGISADNSIPTPLVLQGHNAGINAVEFSPNSRQLASGSHDGTIRLWDLGIETLLERARRVAGRALTPTECERFGFTPADDVSFESSETSTADPGNTKK